MSTTGTLRVRIGRTVAGLSVVAAPVALALTAVYGRWGYMLKDFDAHGMVIAAGFGIVSWVALPSQPRNGAVWMLTLSAGFSALYLVGGSYAVPAAGNPSVEALYALSPSELSDAARFTLPLFLWAPVPAVGLLITLGVLLFPEGRFASRPARTVGWLSVACITLVSTGLIWVYRPGSTMPLGADVGEYTGVGRLVVPATVALMAASLYAVVSWVRCFLSSTGEARQQHRWVGLGAGTLVVGLLFSLFNGPVGAYDAVGALVELFVVAIAVAAYGIALVKYRLWDIDVVINKTMVFVGLAAFITVIYVSVAVGIGELIGGSGFWLSILATAIVAVAFEPARTRAQRWANRLVYGARATPYEVLSEIAGKLATAESEEGLLERMASMLGAATGARRTAVWLTNGDGLTTAATSPPGEHSVAADVSLLPGAVEVIRDGGEVLGALTVEKSRGDVLIPTERALITDLAGSAALVLRRLRLDAELQATARQLDRSRRRLVGAQDVERRRLERDLHDGVEQLVVELKVALEEARRLADEEGTETAASFIDRLVADTRHAVQQIRSLAQGLFPPLLQAEGLGAAVPELAALSPLEVHVDADVSRPHPLQLEGAVYFCISEALTNASKHGRGPVFVRVGEAGGGLSFDVTDSGPGFDPQRVAVGAGLKNMVERLERHGGTLTIASTPGASTTISGTLPVGAMTSRLPSPLHGGIGVKTPRPTR